MSPSVSIVTVVYNAKEHFISTLKSVKEQTYSNVEYIVIDGGSKDGTLEIVQSNQDTITKYLSEPDEGIYHAMNKGIDLATGEWIMFLNAGDTFYEKRTLSTILEKDLVGKTILYGAMAIGSKDRKRIIEPKNLTRLNLIIWGSRTVCHQAMVLKRSSCVQYNQEYIVKADLDWMFRILEKTNRQSILNVDTPIVHYLLGGFSSTVKTGMFDQLKIQLKHCGVLGLLGIPMYSFILIRSNYHKLKRIAIQKEP